MYICTRFEDNGDRETMLLMILRLCVFFCPLQPPAVLGNTEVLSVRMGRSIHRFSGSTRIQSQRRATTSSLDRARSESRSHSLSWISTIRLATPENPTGKFGKQFLVNNVGENY